MYLRIEAARWYLEAGGLSAGDEADDVEDDGAEAYDSAVADYGHTGGFTAPDTVATVFDDEATDRIGFTPQQ